MDGVYYVIFITLSTNLFLLPFKGLDQHVLSCPPAFLGTKHTQKGYS